MLNHPIQVLKQTELLGHQFTVYGTAENPLFLAKEVAECIEHSNITVMLQTIDEEEKVKITPKQSLGDLVNYKEYNFLTEDGLYEVLMQSRKPIAKQFKKGVKQILHEVRTTGGYIATKADDTPEEIMARALTIAQATLAKREERLAQEKKQLEQQNAKLQPKAAFADAAFATDDKVDIGMSAKILKLGFGRNTLFDKLRKAGVFFANRNEPKQRFIDAGYFEMKEKFIERNNHPGFVVTKVLVTQKGLAYLNHLFGGKPSDGKLARIV
jgi:prophage antirepressor-like protein